MEENIGGGSAVVKGEEVTVGGDGKVICEGGASAVGGDRGGAPLKPPFWKQAVVWIFEVISALVILLILGIKWLVDVYSGASLDLTLPPIPTLEGEGDDKEEKELIDGGDGDKEGAHVSCLVKWDDGEMANSSGLESADNGLASGSEDAKAAFDVFPKKVWMHIGENIQDPKDWLNFIRSSSCLEKLLADKKAEKLLPETIKHIFNYLDPRDQLNLRLINKHHKSCVDSHWSFLVAEPRMNELSNIYLTSLKKVSGFTRALTTTTAGDNPSTSSAMSTTYLPFTIVVGLGSPADPDFKDDSKSFEDKLTTQVFWKAFALSTEKLGYRITSLILDIRIDPNFGVTFAEEIVNVVIFDCLKKLPNVKYMVIINNTVTVEKALSSVYSMKSSDFPSLQNLETLEIITLGEGHPSKTKFKTRSMTFPSRFLHQHGTHIKNLRIYGNLYDFKSMGVLQAPSLDKVLYEIHHCLCEGKEADLKALLQLPVIEQEDNLKKLKEVCIKVNWQWRTSDISSFFKWLGRNYQGHEFEKISLRNTRSPVKSLNPHYHQHHDKNGELACICDTHQKKVNVYGSDFPWLDKMKVPKIKILELLTEYEGSWKFLRGIRKDLEVLVLQKQGFFRNEDIRKEVYRKGLVKDVFSKEALMKLEGGKGIKGMVIWEYFPKLKEIVVVWRSINYKNVNWDMEVMLKNEEYKKRDIIRKMSWRVTREEFKGLKVKQEETFVRVEELEEELLQA